MDYLLEKESLLNEGLRIIGNFRYRKIFEIFEEKGTNGEITERLTIKSRVNLKNEDSFKETFKDIIKDKYYRK